MAIDVKLLIKAMQFVKNPLDEEIEAAALALLKMNRNQVLYRNIITRPVYMKKTLIYNLKKCIDVRVPLLTKAEAKEVTDALNPEEAEGDNDDDDNDNNMPPAPVPTEDKKSPEERLEGAVNEALKNQPGVRKDHETLPDTVKEWYEGSKKRWFELKQLHDTLQTMDDAEPSERAAYTIALRKKFGEYRKCLNDYDHFDAKKPVPEPPAVNIAQKVATARKYLSDNREKLAAAIEAKDDQKVAVLREKMQERITLILHEGLGFDPQIKEALTNLGLNFD